MSQTYNTFDLIFIGFAFIFIIVAFFRGFVKEIFSLLIWILALSISYFGAPFLAKALSSYSGNKMVLDIVSRTVLFIIAFFALLMSTSSFSDNLKDKFPPFIDRSLGILYGISKTLLVFGVFYAVTANLYSYLLGEKQDPNHKKVPIWLSDARCGGLLKITGEAIDPAVEAFISAITKNLNKPGFLPKALDSEVNPQSLDNKINEVVDEDDSNKKSKNNSHDYESRSNPNTRNAGDFSKVKTASDTALSSKDKAISKNNASSPDDELADQIQKETGYDKKNIDKLGRLIDVINKVNQ